MKDTSTTINNALAYSVQTMTSLQELEYVDDSEPERKRIRLQTKKRTRQKHSPSLTTSQSKLSLSFSRRLTQVDPPAADPPADPPAADSSAQTLARSYAAPASPPQFTLCTSDTGAQEVSLEPSLMASMERFAYHQVRAKTEPATSHTERYKSASMPQTRDGKTERLCQRAKSLPFPDHDITKLDVSRLLTCLSCEARWTVHKGASTKLSHLVACSRKKGISPSTLKALIDKENLKLQDANTKDETTPPSSNPATAAPQTYMEVVVANALPKKRQRRPDATGTLQPISQTKAAILDRAKALLGTREIAPRDAPGPELTQTFGRSKLASEHVYMADTDPVVTYLSGESVLSSKLDLLRSMAGA